MNARIRAAPALSPGLVFPLAVVALAAMVLGELETAWSSASWDVAWTAGSLSALAGMLLARRAAAPDTRLRWTPMGGRRGLLVRRSDWPGTPSG